MTYVECLTLAHGNPTKARRLYLVARKWRDDDWYRAWELGLAVEVEAAIRAHFPKDYPVGSPIDPQPEWKLPASHCAAVYGRSGAAPAAASNAPNKLGEVILAACACCGVPLPMGQARGVCEACSCAGCGPLLSGDDGDWSRSPRCPLNIGRAP
jgi:hypothetical protein